MFADPHPGVMMTLAILTSMMTLIAAPVAGAVTTARVGNARYTFQNHEFAPVFQETLILGHTISADFMVGMVSRSLGPGTILATKYAGRPVLANLAEPRAMTALEFAAGQDDLANLTKADCERAEPGRSAEKQRRCEMLLSESPVARRLRKLRGALPLSITLEAGLNKIQRLVDQIDDDSAPSHRLDFMNRVYERSTVIVGVDALYLNATTSFDNCADIDVNDVLNRFVRKTFNDGKVVILGTVPKEDYDSFSILNRLALYPQIESCRQEINQVVRQVCTPEQNCYVVDLEKMVADLARDRYLTLYDGTRLSPVQVRPDGVNLSNRGTQFIVEDILGSLMRNPPREVRPAPLTPR